MAIAEIEPDPLPLFHNHTIYADESHMAEKRADLAENGGRYGLRGLTISEPDSTVQIDPTAQSAYPAALRHFDDVGLAVSERVVFSDDPLLALQYPDHTPDVYKGVKALGAILGDERWIEAADRFEDKNQCVRFLQSRGHPTARTIFVEPGEPLPDLSEVAYPGGVKPAVSANGCGIIQFRNPAELRAAMEQTEGSYQIQQWIPDEEIKQQLSAQYRVGSDGTVSLFAVSEQLVDPKTHQHGGNKFNVEYDEDLIAEFINPAAQDLANEGLKGYFGLDLLATHDGQVLILECNPRKTGATYPELTANKLGLKEYGGYVLETVLRDPDHLRLGDLSYNSATQVGIVAVNFARPAADGKVELLIAGTPEEQAMQQSEVQQLLNTRRVRGRHLHLPHLTLPSHLRPVPVLE